MVYFVMFSLCVVCLCVFEGIYSLNLFSMKNLVTRKEV